MLRNFWNRLTGARRAEAVEREVEREQDSPAERRLTSESVEDYQADESSIEHLGGFNPDRLIEDDRPPRDDRL
jgi:hypothetical protein